MKVYVSPAVRDFDEWAATDQSRRDRAEFIRIMRSEGRTLEEIAGVFGVSRERIRQIAEVHGIEKACATGADPVRLITALRLRAVTNQEELAAAIGDSTVSVAETLRALGLTLVARRLFRWRRMFPRRARTAAVIRREASRLGRTPTLVEIATAAGIGPTAAGPMLVQVFGSVRAAMRYCNLTPRSVGGKGHTRSRKEATHCRRGHEWSPENTYTFRPGRRQCRACKRLSRRTAA